MIEFVRDIYRAFMGNFIRSNNDISKIIKIKTVSILLDELIIPVSESVSKFLSDIRTRNNASNNGTNAYYNSITQREFHKWEGRNTTNPRVQNVRTFPRLG